MNRTPYVRAKDFDHEDVVTEFHADTALSVIANLLASIGVFAALMMTIAFLAQVPESWLTWALLAAGGV